MIQAETRLTGSTPWAKAVLAGCRCPAHSCMRSGPRRLGPPPSPPISPWASLSQPRLLLLSPVRPGQTLPPACSSSSYQSAEQE